MNGSNRILGITTFIILILFHYGRTARSHAPDPDTWWVWVKHPDSIDWITFAPAYDYDDCVKRMLPKVAGLFTSAEPMRDWPPRFKCQQQGTTQ